MSDSKEEGSPTAGAVKFLSPIAKAKAAAKAKRDQSASAGAASSETDTADVSTEAKSSSVFSRAEAEAQADDATEVAVDTRPSVLVLGGTGMIGRNFVAYLIQNGLASKVRVADKMIPVMGFMHPTVAEIFESDSVEFVQADLTKPAHIDKAFAKMTFDFVVNFAAETRYGQPPQVYEERCTMLSKLCAEKAAQCGVKKFIEVSTAQVYKSQGSRPSDESAALKPWTKIAAAKLAAEGEVTRVSGLYSLIVRPSYVYGPGDTSAIMPRAVCAAAYIELGEKMKFLWDASMKINTVHVIDVCRAVWHLLTLQDARAPASGSIFNLSDKSDTDQGKVNTILEQIFGIRTGFQGTIISNLARLSLGDVVDTANEKHMRPWSDSCRRANIDNSPLSPFMSVELLDHNHLYIDGSRIEKTTGFSYSVPVIDAGRVRESVQSAIDAGIFPSVMKT